MVNRNVSRCSIPAKGKDEILVKIKNNNNESSRTFKTKAFDKDSQTNESLSIYLDGKLINSATLSPGEEKIFKVDTVKVLKKVSFEITQEKGGTGVSVSTKNKGPSSVVISIK